MMINQTIDKLNYMKMFGMVAGLDEQAQNPEAASLAFEERISLLVDREWTDRENRKLVRLLKEAKLKVPACTENLSYSPARGLDRSAVASLSSFEWTRAHHNVIITGATGTGKTYLSCALGTGACRCGMRTLYLRVPKLLEEIRISHLDGSYVRHMARLGRLDLLILDDWGISALSDTEAKDFLEVIEECSDTCSIIISGQLPPAKWHEAIANPTIADAICDRLIHSAYKFNLEGESMRKTQAKVEAKTDAV